MLRNRTHTDKGKGKKDAKVFEGGSVEEGLNNSSLISDQCSDEDDSMPLQDLTAKQVRRWFERGSARFRYHTRMDEFIDRVLIIEKYIKDFMGVDLAGLEGIRHH